MNQTEQNVFQADAPEHHPTEILFLDPVRRRMVSASQRACANLQYSLDELLRLDPSTISETYSAAGLQCVLDLLDNGHHSVRRKSWYRRKDDSLYPVDIRFEILHIRQQRLLAAVCSDFSDCHRMEGALTQSHERLELAMAAARLGLWEWEPLTDTLRLSGQLNNWLEASTALSLADLLRQIQPGDRQHLVTAIEQLPISGLQQEIECRLLDAQGQTHWMLVRCVPGYTPAGPCITGIMVDISERKDAQQKVAFLAAFDPLTGLANQHQLHDRLEQALQAPAQPSVAVLLVGLNHFRDFRETVGPAGSGQMLVAVARRITQSLSQPGLVAHLNEDEFAVLMPYAEGIAAVQHQAQRILKALSAAFLIEGNEYFLSMSIGIAHRAASCALAGGAEAVAAADTLLKQADIARHAARKAKSNTCELFSAEMEERAGARMYLRNQLWRALERDEISVLYQPQYDLRTGGITGVEALMRWQHPQRGAVSPAEFIPLAEESGVINQLGLWILQTACRQNKAWQDLGLPAIRMGVNLSVRQLRNHRLAADILQVLEQTGLVPEYLDLEITEGLLIEDIDACRQLLRTLADKGVKASLDDFGTGYSSLGYLNNLDIDTLKMDGLFMRNLVAGNRQASRAQAIARAIVRLAHDLGLKVIAEGVETDGQFKYLAQIGCDAVQGFLFSRPVAADAITRLLQAQQQMAQPRRAASCGLA
jgi:diguanylate cyclase (GGDEF)-like protein